MGASRQIAWIGGFAQVVVVDRADSRAGLFAKSVRDETGMIKTEVFDESKVPAEPAVFKDRIMAPIRIYVNDAARAEIEPIVAHAGLTGVDCGTPQRF